MRTFLTCFFITCLELSTMGQATEHEFRCLVNTYTFELPNNFSTSHSNYTEGDYYNFFKIDTITKTVSTRLTLHCGSNVKLPHLRDSTFIVERTSEVERSGTQTNDRYWRELNLSRDINIFYQDATADERELLDEVIEHLLKQIKTGR